MSASEGGASPVPSTSTTDGGPAGGAARHRAALARGGLVNLLGTGGETVARMLLLLVLTRALGAGRTGAFLEALAIFQIVAVLGVLGVDTGVVRFTARDVALDLRHRLRARVRTVVAPVATAAVAGGATLFLGAGGLATAFGSGEHASEIAVVLRQMAPFLPVAVLTIVVLAATRGTGNMAPTAVLDRAGRAGLQVVACLAMVVLGAGLRGITVAWGAAHVVTLVLALAWFARLAPAPDGRAALARSEVRAFWRFTMPRAASSAFRVGIQWLDVLLVGALASTRDAAVYAVASRLLQVCALLSRAGAEIAQPLVSGALAGGDRARANDLFRTTTTWLVLLSWPLVVALAVFAPTILGIFGDEFRDGVAVLLVLSAARLASTGAGPADMVLLMAGRSTSSMAITAVSLTLNVVLNILLIPRMGMVGAALAWTASIAVSNGSSLAVLRWQEGLGPFGRRLAMAAVGTLGVSLGITGGVRAVLGQSMTALVVASVLLVAVHGAWLHRRRETFELTGLWRQLRRPRARPPAPRAPARSVAS